MSGILTAYSDRFTADFSCNSRLKGGLSLRWRETGKPIHVDEINPVVNEHRESFLIHVPEHVRDDARLVLTQLAELVTADRAQPREKKRQEADPFPSVEPWEDAVDGAELLDSLVALLDRYVVLPAFAPAAIALWVLHTYLLEIADYTPYLLLTSPTRECGKSTVLDVLVHLAYRARQTGGITAAALYRTIATYRPTMLLDELDARLQGPSGEALRGVLNTGFHRAGNATICVGDEHEARDFSTFCPKVIAGIGRVWDTVTSRSIPIRLARATKKDLGRLTKVRGDRIGATCLPYRRQATRWASDSLERLRVADAVAPTELGARQSDVWRPLLAIADAAGGRWPELAREAARALHGVAEEEGDYGLLALQDVKAAFECGDASLPSARIVAELGKMEHRPWPEYRNEKPLSTRGLASLLGRFGVKPKNIRSGAEVVKGYEFADLLPAFTTYLVPSLVVLAATSATAPSVADVADKNDVGREEDRQAEADERAGLMAGY